MPDRFDVLLPAAGSGSRFASAAITSRAQSTPDKLLTDLGGKTVLQRAVALFASRADVGAIVIVTTPDRFETYREHIGAVSEGHAVEFIAGGKERWESVLFGLRAIAARADAALYVAVHDAARPLTPASVIDEAFQSTVSQGAGLPCVPEPATLKRQGADGCVNATVDRRGLFQAQTPQCFDQKKLLAGYEALLAKGELADVTDDAQVFERMGWPVPITAGSPLNVKITTVDDVALARAICGMGG